MALAACGVLEPMPPNPNVELGQDLVRSNPALCVQLADDITKRGLKAVENEIQVDWLVAYFQANPDGPIPPPADGEAFARGVLDECDLTGVEQTGQTGQTGQTLPIDDRPTDDATVALETIEFSQGRLLRESSLPWSWINGEWVNEPNRTVLFIAWRTTDIERWSELTQEDEIAGLALPLQVMSESLVVAGLSPDDIDLVILALNDPIGTAIEAHATDLFTYAAGEMSMEELLVRVAFSSSE